MESKTKAIAEAVADTPAETPALERSGRPVLITTEFGGVFFGYAEGATGDTVTLTHARNCIYWPSANGGFLGLAAKGPVQGARIGERVEQIELRKVTSVTQVTDGAARAWEEARVHVG